MVVHGKTPKEVVQTARKAWIALALTPVIGAAVIAVGEVLFSAMGYSEQQMLPSGQRILVSLLIAPLLLGAPVLAARWGHQAFSAGNRNARIPGFVGPILAVLIATMLLGAAFGRS